MANIKAGIKKILKKAVVALYKLESKVLPIRKDVVLFMSNMGKNYSGNPKAIYEALEELDTEKKLKPVWAFTSLYLKESGTVELTGSAETVRYGSFRYYRILATAGKWVFDTRQEPYLVKRKGCTYIQTWHGTPLKKLGLDIEEMNMAGEDRTSTGRKTAENNSTAGVSAENKSIERAAIEKYHNSFREESAKWDYLVAQNDFSAETFKRCFDYGGRMLLTGYPRNDVLKRASISGKIKCGNPCTEDGKKILLYAPTWRDDSYLENGWYGYDSPLDFEYLEKKIGDRCRIIVKLHYLVHLKKGDIPENCINSGFVTVCGNDEDIAEIYLKADALITDYSSVMFDYAILGRPMFFFAYDLEKYRDRLRGFYFDFEQEAPGPISETTEQLIGDLSDCFENGNSSASAEKYEAFRKKYNMYEDGHASEKIAKLLMEA